MKPAERARRAKESLARQLEDAEGFVGAGVSRRDDGYEILVLVETSESAAARTSPEEWEGVPVRVQVSGTPRAF